jgi:uncharacterized protein (DUF697 family)
MVRKSSELENVADPDVVSAKSTTSHEASDGTDPANTAATSTQSRDEIASTLVDNFALWSGAAGLIPIPLVDLAALGGLQLQMVRRLSQIYGVPFSENSGKALIASLAGSAIPTSSGIGAASMLKAIPFVGTIASALALPALSSGATYAIGKAFMQHFASGGTFLDFNPPDYREFIKAQKNMWSSQSDPANTSDEKAAAHPTNAPTN